MTDLPRILIVDDQASNVLLVHAILGDEWSSFAATSGAEALTSCAGAPPDLILLDVNMPGMDGLDTCRRLKSNPLTSDIPVIFITVGTSAAEEDACWNAGAADFVAKPINPTTLRHRVRAQLAFKRQSDQLRQLAFSDGLTGLANRRRLDARIGEEWRRCGRAGLPLALVLADIDHFKLYNDRYGHQAGDACLEQVARAFCRAANRAQDLVARYGGEEFAIVLPETDAIGVRRVAQRVLDELAALGIAHAASPTAPLLTSSLGIATLVPDHRTQTSAMLIQAADGALYQAKADGRNRFCMAEHPARHHEQ